MPSRQISLLSVLSVVLLSACSLMGAPESTIQTPLEASGAVTATGAEDTTLTWTTSTEDTRAIAAYLGAVDWEVLVGSLSGELIATKEWEAIYAGSRVRTSSGAYAEIIYSDASIVRINELSEVTIPLENSTETLSLEIGELWARIIRPFTDSSSFTVSTSDLSAGVRGTSVLVTKTLSGSDVEVFDSTEGSGAVDVTYVNASGAQQVAKIDVGARLKKEKASGRVFRRSNIAKKERLAQKFVRQSQRRDLVYLSDLVIDDSRHKTPNRTAIDNDRAREELVVSLPKSEELPLLFESGAQRESSFTGRLRAPDVLTSEIITALRREEKPDSSVSPEEDRPLDTIAPFPPRDTSSSGSTKEPITSSSTNSTPPIETTPKTTTSSPPTPTSTTSSTKPSPAPSATSPTPTKTGSTPTQQQPTQPLDSDDDWVPDEKDICGRGPDSDDMDRDGIPDACDNDRDADGFSNLTKDDNCPNVANADQKNKDGDNLGDACDPDRDGDTVPNARDNCPDVKNPDQLNTDSRKGGDACEAPISGEVGTR